MSAEHLTRPTVCVAPTARSKCQSCSEKIESGSQRVGMPARHAGLSVTRWLHPVCFVNNLLVDTAPSSRAKCAGDGTPIAKGEPRLLMRLISCEGDARAQKIYKPQNAYSLIQELRKIEGVGSLKADSIAGMDTLSKEQQKWVRDALSGKKLDAEKVPIVEAAPKAASKRKLPPEDAGDKGAEADVAKTPKKGSKSKPKPREEVSSVEPSESEVFEAVD